MNFATLKGLTITEGNVESIAIGGQTVWTKPVDDPWAAVFRSIDAGTYKEKYSIGDTVPLDLGSEGVADMQIAGFDVDDLADGSGKAPISWISKETLMTRRRWNPSVVTNDDGTKQEGTGGIGGWEKCELRAYMQETIKPLIPEDVRSRIVTVTKTQKAFDTAGKDILQTTQEDVTIPKFGEISSSGIYGSLFPDAASRIKYVTWWTRDAYQSNNTTKYIGVDGNEGYTNYNIINSVVLHFCT